MRPVLDVGRTAGRVVGFVLKLPIWLYRYTLKGFFGWHCRHEPTCSAYALEAIDHHGPWPGVWLMVSRMSRCRPGGTQGYDPVPERLPKTAHWWTPWRYGRWRGGALS